MTCDASYRWTVYQVRTELGLNPDNPFLPSDLIRSSPQGKWLAWRMRAFYLLCGLSAASGVTTLILLARPWTWLRCAAVLLLTGAWTGLFFSHDLLTIRSVKSHASGLLPQIQTVAASLQKHWPAGRTTIPPGITVSADPTRPNLIVHENRAWYSFREDIGIRIERSDAGSLYFDLAATWDFAIEYHPPDRQPTKHANSFGNEAIPTGWIELEDNWYLVRYGEP